MNDMQIKKTPHSYQIPTHDQLDHIPELQRRSNFTIRPIYMLIRFLLSLILIPACLSSALICASLQCGAGFGEAIDLLGNSTQIVWSTTQTHYGTVKIGIKVLLGLEDAPEGAELTAYILKASADADQASAAIKNALAKSMETTWQTPTSSKQIKTKAKKAVTLNSVMMMAILGALLPIIVFAGINFLLMRIWFRRRAIETLQLYPLNDQEY